MSNEEEFIKLFKAASHGQNFYETWDAFVSSFAAMIATASMNPCDWLRSRAEAAMHNTMASQEQIYDMWMAVTDAFEEDPGRDLLGDIYMKLGLGSKENGQFFTPYNISKLMSDMMGVDDVRNRIEQHGYVMVDDPAAGGGANLIAFAKTCTEAGINYQQSVFFVGQELSELTALTCYVQLSLLGCPGIVYIGDTLRMDYRFKLYTPAFALSDVWLTRMAIRAVA